MTDLFEQQLRNAARAMPAPEAPAELIDRVAAERAAGARIILPTEMASPRRSRVRLLASLAAAAAIAAFALLVIPRRSPDASADLFVSDLYAAQTTSAPAAPPLTGIDGSRIRPGRYAYRVQYTDAAGHATPNSDGSIAVSPDVLDGTPVWRVEHVSHSIVDDQARTEAESLVVSRRDLAPMSRVVHVRPFLHYSAINIDQHFARDSVVGLMTTDGGVHRPIAQRLPPAFGPFISDAVASLALAGVPLSREWRAGVSVVGWAVVPKDVFLHATLAVIGDERITTPVGSFDCWKLDVVAGREHRIQWVRKADGVGIRSVDVVPSAKGRRQYDLIAEPAR